MDAAIAIENAFWRVGVATVPNAGAIALEALDLAGYSVIRKSRLKTLGAQYEVTYWLHTLENFDVDKVVRKQFAHRIAGELHDILPIIQDDSTAMYENVRFRTKLTVVMPEEKNGQ